MLDTKDNALGDTLTHSSSDSVISSSASLCSNSDGAKYLPGSSQKPPLGRWRSESISNTSVNNSNTKRRFSESGKTVEGKRSFFRGFVRRSISSHSMKEGRVSRETSSEKLPCSKSVNAISCFSVRSAPSAEKVNKIVSKQSVVDSGALSDLLTQKNGSGQEREIDGKDSETPRNNEEDGQSGTELQLWKFQLAAIQYDFPSRPDAVIKYFLLNASINTEEENYKLSLKRKPPQTT